MARAQGRWQYRRPMQWLALLCVLGADELPALKQGEWSYERLVNGQPMRRRACADPTADFKRQQEALTRAGCVLTPMKRDAQSWSFDATCTIKTDKGPVTSTTSSRLTVQSEVAYTLTVHGTGKKDDETLTAKRIGDCPR